MVVVTSIVSVALSVPSVTANVQCPLLCGVTVNVPVPLAGEMVAIPLHEFTAPVAAVVALKLPVKPAAEALKVCAFAPPVAMNAKLLGVSVTALGAGVAVGVGAPDETGVAVGVAVGEPVAVGGATVAVPPELLQPIVPAAIATTDAAAQSAVRRISAFESQWNIVTSL